jgi:hypothetical protein
MWEALYILAVSCVLAFLVLIGAGIIILILDSRKNRGS